MTFVNVKAPGVRSATPGSFATSCYTRWQTPGVEPGGSDDTRPAAVSAARSKLPPVLTRP
jgi:hypothetical protein